jgi:hypothetical protein
MPGGKLGQSCTRSPITPSISQREYKKRRTAAESRKTTMTKRKATFATTVIMTLLAAVIFFVWKFGNGLGFAVIEGIFAVYGFSSLADDCCRWFQMPDTSIMKGGRH